MRITLVKPPENSNMNFGTFNLAVLAAGIRNIAGITILDATEYNLTTALEKTINTQPDLVGITTFGLSSVNQVSDFIRILRQFKSDLLIIAGGHGATMVPQPLLNAGADAVVCGEGELTFKELLVKGISKKIRGLALLDNGTLFKTPPRPLIPDLNGLSRPARDLIKTPLNNNALLETSRGCPYGCIFCETCQFYHQIWRSRSPELVLHDIQQLVNSGAIIIHIVDDNFTANPKRALRICELIQGGDPPMFFSFSSRTDDLLKMPELIPALAKAHFFRINTGIETLEPDLSLFIRKQISFEKHHKAIANMKEVGIYTVGSFIMGLPGETEEMRRRSVELAVKVGIDSAEFIPFQPLPGTPMEKGSGEPEPWCIKAAAEATKEFRRHPVILKRLLRTAKEKTVRGMMARGSLFRRIKERILDPPIATLIEKKIRKIDPGYSVE